MLLCILGHQPGLGAAELEAVAGADVIKSVGSEYALLDMKTGSLQHKELGGVIKIADVVAIVPSPQWGKAFSATVDETVKRLTETAERTGHKVTFGLSVYGSFASSKKTSTLAFTIKKRLGEKGCNVKVVLGEDTTLNSASVIHNKLLGESGAEFLLVAGKGETYIAKTLSVQDIDRYAVRDSKRPKRDTQVGMLPPKLAQMMLNLAKVGPGMTVLDPFCGTGVVLIEAALKNAKLMGSDINPKMIEYTKANLEWLSKDYGASVDVKKLAAGDATTYRWKDHIDRVVTETYLGKPFAYQPSEEELKSEMDECDELITKFLANLKPQLKTESRCSIAIPAWSTPKGLVRLPVIRKLEALGYERVRFSHATFEQMIYRRPDQMVARELLVLTPKQ